MKGGGRVLPQRTIVGIHVLEHPRYPASAVGGVAIAESVVRVRGHVTDMNGTVWVVASGEVIQYGTGRTVRTFRVPEPGTALKIPTFEEKFTTADI